MLILTQFEAASGKAGGLIFSRGRAGSQIRANVPPAQPRTARQQDSRALMAAICACWRALTGAQRQAWNDFAQSLTFRDKLGQTFVPSGYTTFVKRQRARASIGLYSFLENPPNELRLPAMAFCSANPVYVNPSTPSGLSGFTLTYGPPIQPIYGLLVRASRSLSQAKRNFRQSDWRIVARYVEAPAESVFIGEEWLFIYGSFPPIGSVSFELAVIDPLSGALSVPISCSAAYVFAARAPFIPGSVTVLFNEVPAATIPETLVEFDDVPQAGT